MAALADMAGNPCCRHTLFFIILNLSFYFFLTASLKKFNLSLGCFLNLIHSSFLKLNIITNFIYSSFSNLNILPIFFNRNYQTSIFLSILFTHDYQTPIFYHFFLLVIFNSQSFTNFIYSSLSNPNLLLIYFTRHF